MKFLFNLLCFLIAVTTTAVVIAEVGIQPAPYANPIPKTHHE